MAETVKLLKNIAADLKTISKEITAIATQVGKVTKPQAKITAKTKRVKKVSKAKTPKKSTSKKTSPLAKESSTIVDSVLEVISNAGRWRHFSYCHSRKDRCRSAAGIECRF